MAGSVSKLGMKYSAQATIPSGGTVSNAVDLQEAVLSGLVSPSAFDNTNIQFQVSADGVNYGALKDKAGTSYSVVVGTLSAVTCFSVEPTLFQGWRYVKLVAGAPVAADRTWTLVARYSA